jgi:hypothetical protein
MYCAWRQECHLVLQLDAQWEHRTHDRIAFLVLCLEFKDYNGTEISICHPLIRKDLWVVLRYFIRLKTFVNRISLFFVFSKSFLLIVMFVCRDFLSYVTQFIYIKSENNSRNETKISRIVILTVVLLKIRICWKGKPCWHSNNHRRSEG